MSTAIFSTKELVDLFNVKPACVPARLWSIVLEKESANHKRSETLVMQDNGGNEFKILPFLRDHVGIAEDVLDGSAVGTKYTTKQQTCAVICPSQAAEDENEEMMVRHVSQYGSEYRGEYASLKAEDIRRELQNGLIEFTYLSTSFRLYVFSYGSPYDSPVKYYILAWEAPSTTTPSRHGQQLIADVYRWDTQLRSELWVFNGALGGWRKDKRFYAAVQEAREEDLILPKSTMDQLRRDTLTFFQSQKLFKEMGVTWKRGILLLGPPGNGKTGMIKLLAKQLSQSQNIPALYVETPDSHSGPQYGISAIFHKARKEAPCLLILEDVETLVTAETRTTMLNQLDGIESNDGILIIATANDASKLDAAILQRPSRFDAKYSFDLPDAELRSRFLHHWLETRVGKSNIVFDEASSFKSLEPLIEHVAQSTRGWTFAFLKEMFMSVLLVQAAAVSISGASASSLDSKRINVSDLLRQVEVLQVQISQINDKQNKEKRKGAHVAEVSDEESVYSDNCP